MRRGSILAPVDGLGDRSVGAGFSRGIGAFEAVGHDRTPEVPRHGRTGAGGCAARARCATCPRRAAGVCDSTNARQAPRGRDSTRAGRAPRGRDSPEAGHAAGGGDSARVRDSTRSTQSADCPAGVGRAAGGGDSARCGFSARGRRASSLGQVARGMLARRPATSNGSAKQNSQNDRWGKSRRHCQREKQPVCQQMSAKTHIFQDSPPPDRDMAVAIAPAGA
jgi:hypothetical protein